MHNNNNRIHTLQSLLEHHAQAGTTKGAAPPHTRIGAHTGPVYACTASTVTSIPMLLTGGDDGNVHCWRCDSLGDGATPSLTLATTTIVGPCATAAECNSVEMDTNNGHVVGGIPLLHQTYKDMTACLCRVWRRDDPHMGRAARYHGPLAIHCWPQAKRGKRRHTRSRPGNCSPGWHRAGMGPETG